ncbi:MAG: hypothetical protein CMM87_04395 [Rickettsiales bacterium]|nr:hypothetical protein [Rickettsiales bacterium]
MKQYIYLLSFLLTTLINPLAKNAENLDEENPPEGRHLSNLSSPPTRQVNTSSTAYIPAPLPTHETVNSTQPTRQTLPSEIYDLINLRILYSLYQISQRSEQRQHPLDLRRQAIYPRVNQETPNHLRLRRFPAISRTNQTVPYRRSPLSRRSSHVQAPRRILSE